jgi:hypothetical protein
MKFLAVPAFLALALTGSEPKPLTLDEALAEVTGETAQPIQEAEEEVAVAPTEKVWVCEGCNDNEKQTLAFLQERGIKDRAALATVMGNIRQESMFLTDICEGGARVSYENCHSGGFGLIQWTSINRYRGLGSFAAKYGLSPTSLEAQLRWMVNEPQWVRFETYLKGEGQSIEYYMKHAYPWLGWGIHGARSQYSYNYYNRLTQA